MAAHEHRRPAHEMCDQPSAHSQEPALIQRAQEGDLAAFNTLVELYQAHAYNLALRMLGDPAAAEDVTQEAFISAFRSIRRFRGERLRPWLLTIVANACRDLLRSPQRRRTVSLDALSSQHDPQWPSHEESPEEYAIRRELGREIQRGLLALPEDQRLAVVLVDVQGMEYEEAAQAMGVSLGTVKSRLSRGRARLRDDLRSRKELLPGAFRPDE